MTDRIERQIVINAPRAKVWRAIADKTQFGTWFRVQFPPGAFAAGEIVRGNITHPGYEHVVMEIEVADVTPEETLSFRWHPYAIDPGVDYSTEPPTLVTFRLEDADGGTRLSVTESGFDATPAHRRDEAFRMNDHGWSQQLHNIERHVAANG